jgi:hypothetical protein
MNTYFNLTCYQHSQMRTKRLEIRLNTCGYVCPGVQQHVLDVFAVQRTCDKGILNGVNVLDASGFDERLYVGCGDVQARVCEGERGVRGRKFSSRYFP